jgi:RND family efflux transporter MFP subunit
MPGGMGESSGRGSVVTIADLAHLEVDCDVKEDFISRIAIGHLAEIAVDAVPDRKYQGRVRNIVPMGDRARATIKVKVEILDADQRLFPDMSSTVYFLPDESAPAEPSSTPRVYCPTDAIVETADGQHVWITDDEDRVHRLKIQPGDASEGRTEIVSGLSGGERVVMRPPADLRDGKLVRVSQ